MNRRDATLGLASALGLAPLAAQAAARKPVTAAALYARALVVDANLAPPLENGPVHPLAKLDLLRLSGVSVAKTSIGGFNAPFADTVEEIAAYQRAIEAYPRAFLQVRQGADFALAKRTGRFGIIFSFEGVECLEGKVERIDLFRGLGVRVMQLSYNPASPFAAGVLADPPTGLTDKGREAVKRMNAIGVAIDLSHANPATTSDVLALSDKPVLITHGGCKAVHDHPRNKTDEQLRAVAAKGGVIGIYDLPYLVASPRQPNVADYLDHMAHALKVCGEDHVGIGSDQGVEPMDDSPESLRRIAQDNENRRKAGVAAPGEDRPPFTEGLNRPDRCAVVADGLLKRGYSARVAEKVLGLNFARGFPAAWGE